MDDLEGYRRAHRDEWDMRNVDNMERESVLGRVEGQVHRNCGTFFRTVCCGANLPSQKTTISSMGCVLFVLILSLCSIGSLQPTEYGLTYNNIMKSMGTEIYHGGRHWLWPWGTFITFPATVVTVEFSNDESAHNGPLETRTKDGLALELSLSFQYLVEKENVTKLYSLANRFYEPLFIRNARDVLLKAGGDYDAAEYWLERGRIGQEMHLLVTKRLHQSYATCTGLQLLVIHLPPEFESSIVDTQVQKQRIETRQKEQQSARIEAETKVIESEFNRNITVLNEGAKAEFFRIEQEAEAVAQQKRIETEAFVMKYAQEELQLTSEQLLTYQEYYVYSTLKNASMLYGLNNAMPIISSLPGALR